LNFLSDEVQAGASNIDTSLLFPCSPTEPSTVDQGSHTIIASITGGHNPTLCSTVSSPSRSNDITNSSKSASDDSEQRLTCSCGKSFSRPWQLNQHGRCHLKIFKCNERECRDRNIRFAQEKDLLRHRQTKHHKAKLFTCNTCQKSFNRSDNLKRHQNTIGHLRKLGL